MAFEKSIAAVVLAAGVSRRMGRPKMVLPWGETTVIGRVVEVLAQSDISEIIVVTGGHRTLVEAALVDYPAQCVYNPRYAEDDMVSSLKCGLTSLSEPIEAVLVVLGDQPQIQEPVVRSIVREYQTSGAKLVVPSFQMRRGHPWLVARTLWRAILDLPPQATLRDFIQTNAAAISYLTVDSSSILKDLDTPDDYEQERAAKK